MSKSKNVVKKLTTILFTLVAVFAVGLTNVNAKTVTVETEEELINASKGIDSEINEIKLAKDITLTNSLNFHVVNDITLELNGCSLDTGTNILTFDYGMSEYDASIGGYNFGFNSKLTIKDSSGSKAGKILTKKSIIFATYDADSTHNEQIKKFGLTIDGGYYETINPSASFISLFTNDYYTNGKNITVDVKVKDAVFKASDENSLFGTTRDSGSDITFNFNFESLKAMGYKIKLGSNKLGQMKLDNVIDPNSKAYFQELPYTTGAPVLTEANRNTLVMDFYATGGSNPYIIIKKVNGFEVNNVEINEIYKETTSLNDISIKNISGSDLQIQNVTVDSANFTIDGPSTLPTVSAGTTNTDYKIKAKEGLPAGTYKATITVTDSNNGKYTATVTLKVEKKQLDGLGAGFTSNWTYGETALEPNISGVSSLGLDEYKVEYAKTGTEDWSTIKPTTAGEYTIRLTITGSNYKTSTASSTFKILPTEKVVKIVANSSEHKYDGNAYTDNGYKIYFDGAEVTDGKLLYGDIIGNVKVNGSVTDVVDNATNNNVIDRDDITITNRDSYKNIEFKDGTIKITPITAPIIVTAKGATKTYDGNALTNDGYTYTEGVLVAGDELTATIEGSQKYVGTSDNKVKEVKVMRDGKDITSNYKFGTHENGTLKVTEASQTVNITENLYVKVGETLTIEKIKELLASDVADYDIKFVSGTAGSFDETAGFTGTATGKVTMEVVVPARDVNDDGTPEYAEAKKTFYINVVDKENVTISGLTDNQEFTYDGTTKTPWGTGTITVEGNKVDVNELEIFYNGTGSTTYSSKFAPVDAGTYTITYKVKDSNPNYVGSVTYAFTIKKAQLNKPSASTTSFVYDGTSKGYSSFHDSETFEFTGTNTATNVGNYSLTISLKDKNNYEWKDGTTTDVVINWSITQATPDYTVPTGLTGVKGNFLSSIELPYGFTWNNASELLTAGTHTYKATYTPEDTTNYKVIDNIDITVVVKNKFVLSGIVNGGNGTISVSSLEVLEGDKAEVVFTPDEGYMIDKVLVEGTEVEVTGNKLELTMDGNKLVTVSYKKIPFTVTVKDVTGATVTPNGAVSVNYGDNKEFTITVNSGYKLVKVLVNGTDKTADMVDDKLTLSNITANMELEVVVEKIVYEVTDGSNQKYVITKNNEAKFRINADYSLFDGKVYVDGVLVDSENYTSESGSTIITFKKEYVDSLSAGEHTLKVTFTDGGEATTTFTVANVTPEIDNPKTGDNIALYIVTGVLSMIGLAGAGVFAYRRKQTN